MLEIHSDRSMDCISEDLVRQFFIASIFGLDKDGAADASLATEHAIRCAYRDMCRTIRYGDMSTDDIDNLYASGSRVIHDDLDMMMLTNSQNEFNQAHKQTCESLINEFASRGVILYYGQAQKWVNMTFKYLHILKLDEYNLVPSFPYLHIPLDSIVLEKATKQLKLDIKDLTWSRYDYQTYIAIQNEIREALNGQNPLIWEFESWNAKNSDKPSNR